MSNIYVIHSDTSQIVAVAQGKNYANNLLQEWSSFLPSENLKMTYCFPQISSKPPQRREFRVSCLLNEDLEEVHEMVAKVIDHPLPKETIFDSPHLTEDAGGQISAKLFMEGKHFKTLQELFSHAERLILAAVKDFRSSTSQPSEQSVPSEETVLEYLENVTKPSFKVTEIIEDMGTRYGFTQAETFITLAKLVTLDKIHMEGNSVTLKNKPMTAANVVQDQSSSFDGEVIL